jgi:hypothetical protein
MQATLNNGNSGTQIERRERISMRRLLWVGPLTAVVAAIANVIVREIGVLLGAVPSDLMILQEPGVAGSTIIQVLLGVLVFALLAKFAKNPIRTFRIVAIVALILSLSNPLMVLVGAFPIGVTISVATMLTMMVMHVVAAAITIWMLSTLTTEQ